MAFGLIGPTSRASIDGLDVDSSVLMAGEPGVDIELVVEEGYESVIFMLSPLKLKQHLRRRGRDEAFSMPIRFS